MIQDGDRIIVADYEGDHRWLVRVSQGAIKEKGLGVFDPGRFAGQPYGTRTQVAGKDVVLLPTTLPDLLRTLKRKAAMILPKDAATILYRLGVGSGMRIFESGIGTGATTLSMAHAVGDEGQVVVQELREDFRDWAMDNMKRAGVDHRVQVHVGDLTQSLAEGIEGPFDGALLDQPEPWLALPNLLPIMTAGGRIAAFCPQVGQMEKTARTMQELGCMDVRCIETIEREWSLKERGTRPDHQGLLHTAFLVFGTWPGSNGDA